MSLSESGQPTAKAAEHNNKRLNFLIFSPPERILAEQYRPRNKSGASISTQLK